VQGNDPSIGYSAAGAAVRSAVFAEGFRVRLQEVGTARKEVEDAMSNVTNRPGTKSKLIIGAVLAVAIVLIVLFALHSGSGGGGGGGGY
jgi:hypothetical protein